MAKNAINRALSLTKPPERTALSINSTARCLRFDPTSAALCDSQDCQSPWQQTGSSAWSLQKIRMRAIRNTYCQMVSDDSYPNIQCCQSTRTSWL